MTRILIIDDNPNDRLLAQRELRRELPEIDTVEVASAAELVAALASDYDAVVTDFQLCWTDGITVLKESKRLHPNKPVIMFTNTGSEEIAAEALRAGVDDYVIKSAVQYVRLAAAVRAVLARYEDRKRAQSAEREQQRLLGELASERALLAAMLAQLPCGIVVAEAPSGRLLLHNAKAEQLLRHPIAQHQATNVFFAQHALHEDGMPYSADELPLSRALTGQTIENEAMRYQRGDETPTELSVSSGPVRNADGVIVAAASTFFDIAPMKQLEQELLAAKAAAEAANTAKSMFLANMSHEIRTPLAAISGFAELLREPGTSQEERSNYLGIIERNASELGRLIDDILDLSKVEAGDLSIRPAAASPLGLAQEVISTLDVKAKAKKIALVLEVNGPLPDQVVTDPTRLRQILLNIVGNAIKFTDVGQVTVVVTATAGGPSGAGGALVYDVRDSGCGISAQQEQRLFHPFSQADQSATRRHGGTGLGLVIARKFARCLGGDVVLLSSQPGVGSTFRIQIALQPVAVAAATAAAATAKAAIAAPPPNLQGLSVLVADDAADNRLLIKRMLTKNGVRVELAEHGLEAVERALNGDFDLILMDIQMPQLDGYEATKRLRRLGYTKPILALTAHAMKTDRPISLSAGCNEHLTKPLNYKHLLETVAYLTGRGSQPT